MYYFDVLIGCMGILDFDGDLAMALKSSSFQGIVKLNQGIVHELDKYLKTKESQTAAKIYAAFNPQFEWEEKFTETQNNKTLFSLENLSEVLNKLDLSTTPAAAKSPKMG